ncbi:MAG: riboflavin biosynthesis protein RibF [Deltaproteobacteria bacterium]|nr:riboflavin biosynthesis protein RibF [Deltaproteobacteria bacterium]
MQIIRGYKAIPEGLGPVVMTIGTYDGLHLGHRAIIKRVVTHARREGLPALVYSFFPPPWRLLGRGTFPFLILTLEDKIELLKGMGVDILVTEEFTEELRALSPGDFTTDVLHRRLDPKEIHVGYDFRFGRGRAGDWRFLDAQLGPGGTSVRPHGAVRLDGEIIGCSGIREHVCEGRIEVANDLLGRHHVVRGTVAHGDKRGRTIGFPTANVEPSTELVPKAGVYGVQLTRAGGEIVAGIANVGVRPTFGGDLKKRVEVHLFDWDGDIYGEEVQVSFAFRVRDERRFEGIEALKAQIRRDVDTVRARTPWPEPVVDDTRLTWDPKPR